ncbi:MAG TPA: hypothetical protein VLN49_13830 [Gemmatimonadaceae bacterium]|nr:hypothetical protein [Gemmatimonadaceae bacterium]
MRSIVVLIGMTLSVRSAGAQSLTAAQRYAVPEWARPVIERPAFANVYELDGHLNPFCQRADFDGDGKLDFAVIIRERSSGKIGIAFIHHATLALYIVGAGKPGVHGDDYAWVDAWTVFDKDVVPQGAGEQPPPSLKGDALLVFKTQSASAILWWTGTTYRWYQQGD